MTRSFLMPLFRILLASSTIALARPADATIALLPWATRTTHDSDGDGSADLVDNAPGVANNQADADADQIGDVIDPTPVNSNPFLGYLTLGMNNAPTIAPGGTAVFDYLMLFNPMYPTTPPGDYGHIDLDFGGNGVFDATYFGPLTTGVNQISIPASLFVDGTWDLNTPGTYTLHALAYGPGMLSQGVTITSVTVAAVPESAHLALAAAVLTVCCVGVRSRFFPRSTTGNLSPRV